MSDLPEITSAAEFRASKAKPAVSVIVPVYNVEPYLRRCIDSLVSQTLRDIEIILIDDGSTDGSGRICDEYAARDLRIKVLHQDNAGVYEARNVGLDRASADYLMFVDSDDWVEPAFCELPLSIAREQQADLVIFRSQDWKAGRFRTRAPTIPEGILTQEEALDHSCFSADPGCYLWNKLYHRQLFHQLRFPRGRALEDLMLSPVILHRTEKIVYSTAVLYNYNRGNSGSLTSRRSAQLAQCFFDAFCSTTQHLREWGYTEMAERFYQERMLMLATWRRSTPELRQMCTRYFRGLKQCPPHFTFERRWMFRLLVLSPPLYRLAYSVYLRVRP